jgi:hypothetical protein
MMSLGHGFSAILQDKDTDWTPTPISTKFGAEEIGWQALGPAIACTVLATTIVTLRWYTRCRLAHCLGLDDIVILLSIVSTHYGYSKGLPNTDHCLRCLLGVCAPSSAQN